VIRVANIRSWQVWLRLLCPYSEACETPQSIEPKTVTRLNCILKISNSKSLLFTSNKQAKQNTTKIKQLRKLYTFPQLLTNSCIPTFSIGKQQVRATINWLAVRRLARTSHFTMRPMISCTEVCSLNEKNLTCLNARRGWDGDLGWM